MKNLVLRTAIITLSATVFLFLLIFGICAACAPVAMMNVTANLGMKAQSGNYAYRVYERDGTIEHLAYACEIAIVTQDDDKIIERLDVFFDEAGFANYCMAQDEASAGSNHISGGYGQYLYGGYACALYRVGEKTEAIDYAIEAAGEQFPQNNAVIALAYEGKEDARFCDDFASALKGSAAKDVQACKDIINILEDFANE